MDFPAAAQTPRSATTSPLSSDASGDQPFVRSNPAKKTKARWTSQVRVTKAGGAEVALGDGGYSWRKYGEKDILGAKHQRGYYRCIYRHTQGCTATKQMQRSDEDPTLFDVVYHGHHTCSDRHAQSLLESLSSSLTVKTETDHSPSPSQIRSLSHTHTTGEGGATTGARPPRSTSSASLQSGILPPPSAAMAEANAPIAMREALNLTSLGIAPQFVNFTHVTMESDRYICVHETSWQNSVVIIDMARPSQPLRRPITADSALMNPNTRILALQAQIPGTTQDHLQIFNKEAGNKVKSHKMPEQVVFWKWITPKLLGLVTQASVYHWSIEGDSEPVKMFDRTANLANNQIINYQCDPAEKWLVLIGIAPGAPKRPQLVKGNMQLFSVDQQRSEALEAHAASFATFKVPGNENPSTLICFASNATNELHLDVVELGAQPGKPGFYQKQADLLFPPYFQDDFPVGMQNSQKYGLIYVITKLGLLFVYDLKTAAAVYRHQISSHPIFLTAESSTTGGFYAINRIGQVLHATVNDATVVPFDGKILEHPKQADKKYTKLQQVSAVKGPGETSYKFYDDDGPSLSSSISSGPPSEMVQASELEALEHILGDVSAEPTKLSYTVLQSITNNFCKVIGHGGFAVVYQGVLPNGRKVAVKKLVVPHNFSDEVFVDEINCLRRAKHSNIVRFLGYCATTQGVLMEFNGSFVMADARKRLLCFEYVPNGSLHRYLKGKSCEDEWQIRYQIIKGICRGLHYLHETRINHLDLKPGNILLDVHMEPKITDFGLSRCFEEGQTIIFTKGTRGTPGYIAPEIINNGEISLKSDIFALGIIIIKLLMGRNTYDSENWHESLNMDCPQVECCAGIAQACLNNDQHKRPAMGEIMHKLHELDTTI